MIEMQPDELRSLRKAMGLTQSQLADALGMVYQTIGRMEKGGQVIEPRTAMAVLWMSEHLQGNCQAVRSVPYFASLSDFDDWLKAQKKAGA